MSSNKESQEQQTRAIAEALGIQPEEISLREADWVNLMRRAVTVDLHIRRWRAKAKLTLEDLGIYYPNEDPDAKKAVKRLSDLLQLGFKVLLPLKYIQRFDAIESNARKCLTRNSIPTHFGNLVVETSWETWKTEDARWEREYMETMEEICSRYDTVVAELVDQYRGESRLAYRRFKVFIDAERAEGRRVPPLPVEGEFITNYIERILRKIPTIEIFRESFGYERELHFVPLPSMLEEDLQRAQTVRLEAEEERKTLKQKAEEEREVLSVEAQMREEVIRSTLSQKEQLINGYLKDMVVKLRAMFYEATTDVLESIQRNGNLQPRSVVQLNNLLKQVGNLNYFGDKDADSMLNQVQQIISQTAGDRKVGDIESKLRDIATVTRASLMELGERPRSKREVGVMDIPTVEAVRKARKSLSLPVNLLPEVPERRQSRLMDWGEDPEDGEEAED